jgi:hypothetical protein
LAQKGRDGKVKQQRPHREKKMEKRKITLKQKRGENQNQKREY